MKHTSTCQYELVDMQPVDYRVVVPSFAIFGLALAIALFPVTAFFPAKAVYAWGGTFLLALVAAYALRILSSRRTVWLSVVEVPQRVLHIEWRFFGYLISESKMNFGDGITIAVNRAYPGQPRKAGWELHAVEIENLPDHTHIRLTQSECIDELRKHRDAITIALSIPASANDVLAEFDQVSAAPHQHLLDFGYKQLAVKVIDNNSVLHVVNERPSLDEPRVMIFWLRDYIGIKVEIFRLRYRGDHFDLWLVQTNPNERDVTGHTLHFKSRDDILDAEDFLLDFTHLVRYDKS
ncbi:MAG: hypothetical protein R3C18_25255 [Planctomycetaceae bacterium]